MPFFANTNEEIADFLRKRSKAPLHITGNEHDHPRAETLSLSHLNSILLYEPEEMIVSVQAGITLKDLQKTLAEKRQWIPTLVSEESLELTLGAAVAMDHFHPRAKNLGMLRTTILGGTFCTTRGEIFKSGSRVVKSVAGYDIHRAFCGSHGMSGIILDLTLKIQPMPEMFFCFFAPLRDREKILRFYPACLEEFEGKLLIEFAGYKEDVLADIDNLHSSGILIEKLEPDHWNETIKKLIHTRIKENEKILSPEVELLLHQVRRVFDPDGILTKFDFSPVPVENDISQMPVKDFPLRIFPLKKG